MTAIYHPQKMESERLLNAYKLAGVEPPTPEQERHLADLWRSVAITSGTAYMPNAESDPDMWLFHMGKRLAGYMKKVGIRNDFVVNQIRDATLNRTRTNGMIGNEDYPFDILKSALLNREEMKAYMAKQQPMKQLAPPGSVSLSKPKTDEPTPDADSGVVATIGPDHVTERAQRLDDALNRIRREMGYEDTDLTLYRNVLRPYDAATSTKAVQHPNYVQLHVETAYVEEIARMQKGPEKISELDEYIPHCKNHNEPLNDAGKCAICELNKSVSPDTHWIEIDKERNTFFGVMKDTFAKHKATAMLLQEARLSLIHEALGVKHINEAEIDRLNAQEVIALYLADKFGKSEPEKAPETKVEKPAETSTPVTPQKAPEPSKVETGTTLPTPVKETPQIAPLVEKSNGVEKAPLKPEEFEPAQILDEIKTLGGVPLSKLHHTMNRKFAKQYYKAIKAKDGTKGDDGSDKGWTDIDPVGVRKRMDKVFGPQGFGWRIVPMQGIGQVIYDGVEIQHVKDYIKDGKVVKPAYDRQLHSVSMQCFVFEYALIQDGKIHYVQTSAFSCTCQMDERDDAYKGAFTGIMKMALKYFSGYDHFMDKAA